MKTQQPWGWWNKHHHQKQNSWPWKKNIAPRIFDIDTKNDGLDWKCMFCQDMAILATMFPGGISLLWDSQFCTRESWEMQKQPLSYWEFAGETPMLNIWMFQGKSFPYRTSIHLCAIKKQSPNSWFVWDILRSLTPQYSQKKRVFFREKIRHHHVPEPDVLKTWILEKAFKLQLFRTGFSPTGKQTKTYMRQLRWGSTFISRIEIELLKKK